DGTSFRFCRLWRDSNELNTSLSSLIQKGILPVDRRSRHIRSGFVPRRSPSETGHARAPRESDLLRLPPLGIPSTNNELSLRHCSCQRQRRCGCHFSLSQIDV